MYFSVPKRPGLAGLHEAWPPKSQPGLQAAKEPAGRQVFCGIGFLNSSLAGPMPSQPTDIAAGPL
jgi:hypothetical protein